MKKILVILSVFAAAGAAAERMVLGELFTSTTCGPCVSGNSQVTGLLSQKGAYLAVVRYHMSWPGNPGNDPFYHNNTQENNQRRGVYGINGVPAFVVDGIKSSNWGGDVDARHSIESPFNMRVYRSFQEASALASQGEGLILIEVTNERDDTTFSFKVYGVLTESNVNYTGQNGDPVHHQAMIDMVPYSWGEDMTLGPEETGFIVTEFWVQDTIEFLFWGSNEPTGEVHVVNPDNCELVGWSQVYMTKEVLQAAKRDVVGAKDISLSGIELVDSSGDGKFEAGERGEIHVTVTNNSSSQLSDVHVLVDVDNDDVSVINRMADIGNLAGGGSYILEGDELLVEAGPDYDGSNFAISCYAGSADGSLGSLVHTLAIGENPVEGIVPGLPTIAAPGSTVSFTHDATGYVELDLFDVSGRHVAALYAGPAVDLDEISFPVVSNGVYFIALGSMNTNETVKILLLD